MESPAPAPAQEAPASPPRDLPTDDAAEYARGDGGGEVREREKEKIVYCDGVLLEGG